MDKFGEVTVDVQALLESVLKIYAIDPEDLFYKWESWSFKMGNNPALNIENATLFKQDIQNQLELSNQSKIRSSTATPASTKKLSSNVVGGYQDFLEGDFTPLKKKKTRHEPSSALRGEMPVFTPPRALAHTNSGDMPASNLETPTTKRSGILSQASSTPFLDRKEPGAITQSLDPSKIDVDECHSGMAPALTVNFDPKKFAYRPMYQKLSEVSEILDDQIDQYAEIILEAFKMQDEDIGNPSQNTQTETVVVGRVVCDSLDGGRLNASSVMLETSRRLGMGSRTKLDLSTIASFALFPGQLVALRGMNAASEFKVSEILIPPLLPPSASTPQEFRKEATSVIIAAGPYTPNSDLSFEALLALKDVVEKSKPMSVILIGPFIDLTHPLVRAGQIDCDTESLEGVFQAIIAPIIKDFPGLLIFPHVNDAISRHPCFPQEPFGRQLTGLGKQVKLLPNPALFSLDEVSYGVSSNDILKHLTTSEVSRNPSEKNALARQSLHILQQRRFYPLFPGPVNELSSVANLDIGFAGLTEFGGRLPDILISPSEMATFVKVVSGVIVINPGGLSKRAGSGSYAHIYIKPKNATLANDDVKTEDSNLEPNEVWKRARIDIIRI